MNIQFDCMYLVYKNKRLHAKKKVRVSAETCKEAETACIRAGKRLYPECYIDVRSIKTAGY
ncbi:hypothetical protein [Limisalsivibrio acetivorans]|uniref:hypothetical protein n=1 Tax=Limisalsivibrio acetivorans TaxID=1304888 RepID=UPI0003B50E56|nr:hypothetical protein [Limisalsivibrio acetivorans]